MSTRMASSHSLVGFGKTAIIWMLWIGAFAVVVWVIVFFQMRAQNGIYGGLSLGDAQKVGRNAMIVKYGKPFTARLRYAEPAAAKKHLTSVLAGGTQHVWELHMLGRRGVHYCVTVWHPSEVWSTPATLLGPRIDIGGNTLIRKGCSFR